MDILGQALIHHSGGGKEMNTMPDPNDLVLVLLFLAVVCVFERGGEEKMRRGVREERRS
jgi:hypothetical protein